MTTSGLTDLQRRALECMEGARSAGVALSAHVRSRGLNLRGVYDAIAQLRRRGIVPPAPARRRAKRVAAPVRFARVRLQAPGAASAAQPLRLRLWLSSGRMAELDIDDAGQLGAIIAALEGSG